MTPHTPLATLAFFVPVLAPAAAGDVLTIEPAKDNTLYESSTGALSNGAGVSMFVGRTAQDAGIDIRRALVEFDVAAAIPAGASIDAVTLSLDMTITISGPTPVDLHVALQEWGEGTSDAPSGEGGGAPAMPGDATWLHTSFNTAFWTTPGGDFEPVASATTLVAGVASYQWSSAQMAADVQAWLDDPSSNHGWMLIGDEATGTSAKRFATRNAPDSGARPSLEITFTPPSADGGFCFGVACPCANDDPFAGCANGTFGVGALLVASGTPSVANDDAQLAVSSSTPSQPGVFFQGNQALNGGGGIAFGDGLRCAGGSVVRLEVAFADGAGDLSSSVPLAATGGVSPGDVRRYQWWYRDPMASPCGAGFNLSNGFELTWLP